MELESSCGWKERWGSAQTFVPAAALGGQLEVFLPDPLSGGEKELMCSSLGTGELLS